MKPGPSWASFEQLRVRHAEQLAEITPGHYGTLLIKKQPYVVLLREDFQRMQDDVRAMSEIAAALHLLTLAARAASTHQDETTIRTLSGVSGMCMKAVGEFLERQRTALGGEGA